MSLDVSRPYVTVCCPVPADVTAAALERALGFQDTVAPRRGLSTMLDGELVGLLSAPPVAPVPAPVGLGPPAPLDQLADSFVLARRAARTAAGLGLEGVHPFDALGVLPAVVDDEQVGAALRARYIEPLAASAAELADTLRAWFAAAMNVELAARALHVHPNTVRYRMTRFEELTGTSLREPRTALEVWWALQRERVRD